MTSGTLDQDDLAKVLAAVEKYQGEIDEDQEAREVKAVINYSSIIEIKSLCNQLIVKLKTVWQGIRTVVRDIEKATKKIYFVIFNIHSDPSDTNRTPLNHSFSSLFICIAFQCHLIFTYS